MPRRTKLYTRKGDDGTTSLGGGQRVPKNHLRVEAYGTIDELNATLGVALSQGLSDRLAMVLPAIQNELFNLGADLSFLEEDRHKLQIPPIDQEHIDKLEKLIDEFSQVTGPLKNFILPGGSLGAAHLQVARTVCRRAERLISDLAGTESLSPFILPYINRLSDALFAMARYENKARHIPEPTWDPSG